MKSATFTLINARENKRLIPTVTAHSGCEGTPDNSIEHIKTAIASGAEFCEVDVYESNGVLYLTHDQHDDYQGCPTLEDCFMLSKDTPLCFNCDMKTAGHVDAVLDLARKYNMEERILFTGSVCESDVKLLESSPADWWVNIDSSELAEERLANLNIHGGNYKMLNIHYGNATDEVFSLTEKYGFGLSLWTANDEDVIRRIMTKGAMNVTTRRPLLALKIRKELFGK